MRPNISLPKLNKSNVCHLNVNGLASKIETLELILKEINVQTICITEHKFKASDIVINLLDEFCCGSIYCRKESEGGGAAIFIRKGHKYKVVDISDIVVEGVFEAAAIMLKNMQY